MGLPPAGIGDRVRPEIVGRILTPWEGTARLPRVVDWHRPSGGLVR